MRHFPMPSILLTLVGLALSPATIESGWAAAGHSFIIAGNDGYGIQDCLGEGGECGRLVADAWCEAHGHRAALSFGRADDVTGAISASATTGDAAGPYVVTCSD